MKRHFAPDMRSISTVGCAAMLGLAVCGPALLAQSKSREMAPPAEKGEPLVVELWTGKVPDETGEIGAERVRLSPALDRKQVEVTEPTRLITSMERKAGAKAATLGEYPDAVRGVARERSAALIDLQALSVTLYRALGTNLDRAFQDGTHHNNYGSYELAKCVAAGIAHGTPDLARFVVDEATGFDPSSPDPVAEFKLPPSPARSAAKPDGS